MTLCFKNLPYYVEVSINKATCTLKMINTSPLPTPTHHYQKPKTFIYNKSIKIILTDLSQQRQLSFLFKLFEIIVVKKVLIHPKSLTNLPITFDAAQQQLKMSEYFDLKISLRYWQRKMQLNILIKILVLF
jgi:hypothetical protein